MGCAKIIKMKKMPGGSGVLTNEVDTRNYVTIMFGVDGTNLCSLCAECIIKSDAGNCRSPNKQMTRDIVFNSAKLVVEEKIIKSGGEVGCIGFRYKYSKR